MTRQAFPREDLIRDAVALVDRIEIFPPAQPPVVIGFRRDGSASFYFGEQPAYQFNALRELRRAHLDGIIKAEQRHLVRLNRRQADGEVQLVRHQFELVEQREFLEKARSRLTELRDQIEADEIEVGRQVSASESRVLPRVRDWLAELPSELIVAEGV